MKVKDIFLSSECSLTGDLFRSIDWTTHLLGATETWPSELRVCLNILFNSHQPMLICWGGECFLFYNDAYLQNCSITSKHSIKMGHKGKDCYCEVWPLLQPQIDVVMSGVPSNWKSDSLTPLFTNGTVGGVLFICNQEVHQNQDQIRKQIEDIEALNRAAENAKLEAERASNAKSSFLANMSHEIRTPLGAILGFTDLMKDSRSSKERAEFAKIINRNGKSLTKIIDDILDLTKVEAGRLELEKLTFDVEKLTHEVMDLFIFAADKKGIELKIEIDPYVPNLIRSDPTRVRQILINLIGNAVKFTSKGFVKVKIEPSFTDFTLTHIQFSITDTGLGITKDQATKLFEPFSQADHSTTRKYGGSGLGLALSKRLACALGGDVKVGSSCFGKGSTFIATVGASMATEHLQSYNPDSLNGEINLKGVKVLLVEDVIDNQVLIKLFLSKSGIHIEVANNGYEGIEKALSEEYDLILMDMQMPLLDGYEATERLRSLGYDRPIIALTAYAMAEERHRTQLVGCNTHLTKPLDFSLLTKTISEYSGRTT